VFKSFEELKGLLNDGDLGDLPFDIPDGYRTCDWKCFWQALS
jgi:hypothetical protein